jgi:hypothetical protein
MAVNIPELRVGLYDVKGEILSDMNCLWCNVDWANQQPRGSVLETCGDLDPVRLQSRITQILIVNLHLGIIAKLNEWLS